jgi:hypothetical protein
MRVRPEQYVWNLGVLYNPHEITNSKKTLSWNLSAIEYPDSTHTVQGELWNLNAKLNRM